MWNRSGTSKTISNFVYSSQQVKSSNLPDSRSSRSSADIWILDNLASNTQGNLKPRSSITILIH